MADSQVYDDTFTITNIDSSKYERVSRLAATSTSQDTSMTLDVNTEIYPCSTGETLQLSIATTLSLDGSKQDDRGWRDLNRSSESTLADMWDYVCRGKVYKFEQGDADTLRVFMSFGGLLLYLEGPYKKLTSLRQDYVYLLIKK